MSVHLAVPIRSTARVHVELTAKPIHLPLQVTVFEFRRQPAATTLQVEVAEDQSTEMRSVGDTAGRGKIGECTDNNDEILRRNWKDERHQDRTVGVIHRERQQNAEERTRSADCRGSVRRLRYLERQPRYEDRGDRCADSGYCVVPDKKLRAPEAFELDAEHPHTQHIEE